MMASFDVALRMRSGKAASLRVYPDLVRRLESAAKNDDLEPEDEVAVLVAAIVQLAESPGATRAGVDVQLIEVLSSPTRWRA